MWKAGLAGDVACKLLVPATVWHVGLIVCSDSDIESDCELRTHCGLDGNEKTDKVATEASSF